VWKLTDITSEFLVDSLTWDLSAEQSVVVQRDGVEEVRRIDQSGLAVSTVCPHFGGPLEISGENELFCPWHGWKFDMSSGTCKNRKSGCRLTFHRLRREPGGD